MIVNVDQRCMMQQQLCMVNSEKCYADVECSTIKLRLARPCMSLLSSCKLGSNSMASL